jgi:cardiolipin synthase
MMAAIESARQEILLEMYWFASDATGQRFARALEEKARAGLRVCVTYDAVGSFEADRGMFARMQRAGCSVYEWNPLTFGSGGFTFGGWNRRNHRKLLIVDGHMGFTGGVNLGDAWAPESEGGLGFRDDMVRIEGPAAGHMRSLFLNTFRGDKRSEVLATDLTCPPLGRSRVRTLANDSRRHRRLIERAYLQRIRAARSRISIVNSYFIPRRVMRHALAAAVRRGVEVRVLVPQVSDVPVVTYATHRLYDGLLARGIQIYEWTDGVLHSKVAAIDGEWCTVGTHNLDYRSFAYNLEINVVVEDPAVAQELEARIAGDFARGALVNRRDWSFRPLGTRILEEVFYAFRRLL